MTSRASAAALAAALLLATAAAATAQTAIVTYHYDVNRSGWNQAETVLTPQSVGGAGSTFGLLTTVPLDGFVDAQPLVVPGVVIAGDPNAGKHDVVYVETDNNTIFAIDPTVGTVLLSRSLGAPVPMPRGCEGDFGVGIVSTPVIDLKRGAMYLISPLADTAQTHLPYPMTYQLHMLDLATLADMRPPVTVAGTQTLTDGSSLAFIAGQQRQRPALLEHGNRIYAGFGSVCDNVAARGWLFAWSAENLAPVVTNASKQPVPALTNHDATAPDGGFLSSIWMSGAGPAADATGVYYVTGNSDKSGTTYNAVNNTENSVVRLSLDTTAVLDVFTPGNLPALDPDDVDFGSGGVMLLPSDGSGQPPMAAAAGKFGTLYLLNRTNLGGYTPGGPDKVLAEVVIGGCWCAPSYFNDGTPTLVSSAGDALRLWSVPPLPTTALKPRTDPLVLPTPTGRLAGFFTSVSSNGKTGTIVWAVTRPHSVAEPGLSLYAFAVGAPGSALQQVFTGAAGTWSDAAHNPSTVPVVANGRLYVASQSSLAVFGLGATSPGEERRE